MRRTKMLLLALTAAASTMAVAAPKSRAPAAPDYAAAVAASDRPADDVKLDASRKPAELLAFMGLKRGDRALDLFTGGGYYAEIMARAVGPTGHVTAWEPANFFNDKAKEGWAALHGRVANTSLLVSSANSISLPPAAFDFAMIHLNYHDTYWESAKYNFPRVDPDAVLRSLYQAMKPGGTVAVVDHVANPGGDTRAVVDKLHRIDPAVVKADFERAGFVLDGQSDMFRNPADDHSKLVFDPSIRGNTDRFAYRFRKPKK
jgi:predicted methyltransferase